VHVFHAHFGKTLIVAVRGTQPTGEDIFTDLQFTTVTGLGGKIHQGFRDRSSQYESVLDFAERYLEDGGRVIFTGHSLGGAVASILTLKLLRERGLDAVYHNQLLCISFGTPLIGDAKFAKEANAHSAHFFTYVNKADIVPRVLLLHKEVLKRLYAGFKGEKILTMAKNRLTDALKTALMGTAAAAGTLGGGAAAMAAAGFVDAAGQLISWYASDVTPEYEPFGTYLFCQQTGKAPMLVDDPKLARVWMKEGMPFPSTESIMDHSLENYAHFLEVLRARVV